jgi:hypothetical protein
VRRGRASDLRYFDSLHSLGAELSNKGSSQRIQQSSFCTRRCKIHTMETPNLPEQRKEHSPQISESLVRSLTTFKDGFHPNAEGIYYPSSGIDASIAKAFPESRIVFLDIEESVVESLKKAGYEAVQASSQEFVPDKPVDVLLLLNPATNPEKPVATVAEGGYVLCNDYHGTASQLRDDQALKLVAMIREGKGGEKLIDMEPEDYWREIETDEEFKNAPFSWGAVDYENAKLALEKLGRPTDNVLAEYKKLLEEAKEESRKSIQKEWDDREEGFKEVLRLSKEFEEPGTTDLLPEQVEAFRKQYYESIQRRLAEGASDMLMIKDPNNPTMPIILDGSFPRKKGTVDDLFVYQKVHKSE